MNNWVEQKIIMKNGGVKREFKARLDSKVQKKIEKLLVKLLKFTKMNEFIFLIFMKFYI